MPDVELVWHRIAALDEQPEGRVKTVVAGRNSLALTHYEGTYGALDNHCPHQGGPLGEGSIEKGWLRCPWHGYDYDPLTGTPPPGFTDAPEQFPVEVLAHEIGHHVLAPATLTDHGRMIARMRWALPNGPEQRARRRNGL